MKNYLRLLFLLAMSWLPLQLTAQTQTHLWEFDGTVVNNWIDGWTITNYDPAVAENGILKLHGTKTNNLIRYDVPAGTIDPQVSKVAVIRMKNETIHTKARFYWWTVDPTVNAAFIEFNISANDTEFKEYFIDLSSDSRWDGTIKIIRFDIPAALSASEFGKPIHVDNVRLLTEAVIPEDPNAQYTHTWDFASPVAGNMADGWAIVNYTNAGASAGILNLTASQTYNHIRYNVPADVVIDASKSITAVIRLKNETPQTLARFYWWKADPAAPAAFVEFDITPNDTEFKEYRINLKPSADWVGNIRIIRFDIPATLESAFYGQSIKIDYVKLSSKEETAPEEEPLTPMPARWPAPFGVNLAGAEFGVNMPGVLGTDYGYPTKLDLDYFKSKNMNMIRFPFKWERVQLELNGPLHRAEIDRMRAFMDEARKRNMWIVLDFHNYGRRKINNVEYIIGSPELTIQHVTDVWGKLAQEFKEYDNIWGYGIMNEPHGMLPSTPWFDIAQAIINKIRETDTVTPIIVGGDSWSSGFRWLSASDNLKNLTDPFNKLVFEAHVYFDKNHGGGYPTGYDTEDASPTVGIERLAPFVNWLRENNLRGFVGEYGVPDDDPRWLVTLDNTLKYMSDNCMGGTYWAAGPRWGTYRLAIQPRGGEDRPQMPTLEKYTVASADCAALLSARQDSFGGKLEVYPNPAQNELTVSLGRVYASGLVQVTDVLGREVQANSFRATSQFSLQLDTLKPGIYLVRITSGSETSVIRIIKQ